MILEPLVAALKALCATLPDQRKGDNTSYSMADIGMGAFGVFFMQSPSFMAHPTTLERGRGTSNCPTLLGMEATCEAVRAIGGRFLFTAKPSSHKTLYSWLDGAGAPVMEKKVKQGARFVTHRYRRLESLPIRDDKDALIVNWLEIEIVDAAGKTTYRNSFVTDLAVTADNVAELVSCGRARWKIENETFNTLKTKVYHLEHNFGHGREHLAVFRATMNLIAFAMHMLADLADASWREARKAVGIRKRFFEDLRAFTT